VDILNLPKLTIYVLKKKLIHYTILYILTSVIKIVIKIEKKRSWGDLSHLTATGEYLSMTIICPRSDNKKQTLQITTDNTAMRLTMGWIITMIDTLNNDLEHNLGIGNQQKVIGKYFNYLLGKQYIHEYIS